MAENDPALWVLVERAQSGDVDAYAAFYDATVDRIYRYVRTRVMGVEAAQDVTSETYLRILARIGHIRQVSGSPVAYLYRTARNLAIDHNRHREARCSTPVGDVIGVLLDRADPDEAGTDGHVLAYLDGIELWAAVKRLPDRQREVLVLRFGHGLNIAETAAVAGMTEPAVRQVQLRGVRRLRRDPRIAALEAA